MYLNYKILNKNLQKQYYGLFYQYCLKVMYGNDVISAESIIEADNE